jgi:CheY-like chemotaxis protein/DNA-binding XRE family transcriptional regulator
MDFANNLRKLRRDKKLSQQALADKLNVAQSTVGMWESGKRTPKLDEINRMAKALKVTVDRLLKTKNDRKVEVIKNEVYVDGKRVDELDTGDITNVLELIELLKSSKKGNPSSTPPHSGAGAKKILIIDDEQGMCETLYSFLVPHNYKVFLTFNGQMGLEYFNEIKPDIVLLDLTMPDIDGVDVLKIIRKVSDVPVLIITAHPEDIADIHLGGLDISGYVEKPFSLGEILNTLKHLIGE